MQKKIQGEYIDVKKDLDLLEVSLEKEKLKITSQRISLQEQETRFRENRLEKNQVLS